MLIPQRWTLALSLFLCALIPLYYLKRDSRLATLSYFDHSRYSGSEQAAADAHSDASNGGGKFRWSQIPQHYPVDTIEPLPKGDANSLPRIQHLFEKGSALAQAVREERLAAVLGNFTHSWKGYKDHAWGKDEAGPLSGNAYDHFGGWAASLVDGLDTLWIMGLTHEFEEALGAIKGIDFSSCALDQLNVFETIIRYMGGLLGAYDLTEGEYPMLLEKAVELGEMVYKAFDTPNRMPITRWDFQAAKDGTRQLAPSVTLIAEIGSINLELTRLAQLTGNNKYYDAVKRIMDRLEEQQQQTMLPGLFPIQVSPRDVNFKDGNLFTLGGMVDSVYEYLPKAHLLLHGATEQFRTMYDRAMNPIQKHLIFKPMTADGRDIRIAGQAAVDYDNNIVPEPQGQHLTCFVGGMVGLGSRAFEQSGNMDLARKLTDGCTWAYDVMPRGIMPEIMHAVPCKYNNKACPFDVEAWHSAVDVMTSDGRPNVEDTIKINHLPQGVSAIDDTRYGLRPEAIESVFVLYRLTGDTALQDKAWEMFNSIIAAVQTEIGAAALSDCVTPGIDGRTDRMESFWFAETLKYFYLIFADSDLVSLDEFVLNTEAHPFRYRTLK